MVKINALYPLRCGACCTIEESNPTEKYKFFFLFFIFACLYAIKVMFKDFKLTTCYLYHTLYYKTLRFGCELS